MKLEIILSNTDRVAIIDDEYANICDGVTWCINSGGYATRTKRYGGGRKKTILMHREIMGLSLHDGIQLDHINGNRLDNRRCNLRICDKSQNNANVSKYREGTSIYKGVYRKPRYKGWYAYINKDNKRYNLGRYNTEEEAAIAYNKKAYELYGEFAKLNVIGCDINE